jgi:hypothetical protein
VTLGNVCSVRFDSSWKKGISEPVSGRYIVRRGQRGCQGAVGTYLYRVAVWFAKPSGPMGQL